MSEHKTGVLLQLEILNSIITEEK